MMEKKIFFAIFWPPSCKNVFYVNFMAASCLVGQMASETIIFEQKSLIDLTPVIRQFNQIV